MRARWILPIAAGLLALVGTVLVLALGSGDAEHGWFAYAPAGDSAASSSIHLLTAGQVWGWGLLWLASVLATGALVLRRAERRPPT